MTNFEKWRQELTLDEALELLGCYGDFCPYEYRGGDCWENADNQCTDCIREYFEQEAEEESNVRD